MSIFAAGCPGEERGEERRDGVIGRNAPGMPPVGVLKEGTKAGAGRQGGAI